MNLVEYITTYTKRGACRCGKCFDATPGNPQPASDHTVDMIFFKVCARGDTNPAEFRTQTIDHEGAYVDLDPLDGKEHSYIELSGWIGDQGLAMQYMALGVLLGVFSLYSPVTILKMKSDDPRALQMAGNGFLAIVAKSQGMVLDA